MEPYVIALDLDGTLLKSDHTTSDFTKDVLKTLQDQGHHIVITTGRSFRISEDIYHSLSLKTPMINNNGALVHHPLDKEWEHYHQHSISLDTARKIIALQKELNLGFIGTETRHNVYVSTLDLPKSEYFPEPVNGFQLLSQPEVLPEEPISFGWFSSLEEQPIIKSYLKEHLNTSLDIRTWGGAFPCLDITPEGVHKAAGLNYLLTILNVPKERLIAFGDEDNDSEMLSFAEYGIAMKNAIPSIKAITKYETTYTNEEDGVAHYLKSFFNI
ncbi:Cof-type HAD-IIB family hydrolase [Granulicatella sp. zg-ZJ]|uniref:Cof-type HAD-IIB family hydrolase n=1 Tax=unclassified Granulicatella TaxID=2630493 RepID=UPI0013BF99E1|nr:MULTISPECIES: Cof-type HAD-IIB family hydrolase [unclassified Granulicatella]MBS4749862.1 HAD family phosphatase [Carnobacteriaceae bacterium zg-ZUI78]NEW63048.1 Cof-type HAD-IIB family hydrolase [Granulicatella sp. zg-ZJ]NEW66947.1 Cof-type HAD-IIB family hydrolase [Granulicatella sp. zg-84]QMI85957.1 HAD family phosphatase [Carnobacteriaceae bacterium zg-84]